MASSKDAINQLLNVIGKRWTLRILWELREEPLTFRQLRDKADSMSMSVLNERLKELKQYKLIETTDAGYALSEQGNAFLDASAPLVDWSKSWYQSL